jgi:hypothetical protein
MAAAGFPPAAFECEATEHADARTVRERAQHASWSSRRVIDSFMLMAAPP